MNEILNWKKQIGIVKKIFLQMNLRKPSRKAYSLLEMVVTLLLTGIVMLGLISIFTNILSISAMANTRTKAREDLDNFVQEFEKDLKNSTRVGTCSGEISSGTNSFKCVVYTDSIYVWQSCPRDIVTAYPYVATNGSFNQAGWDKSYVNFPTTLCKYAAQTNGDPVDPGVWLLRFDPIYNVEYVSATSLEDNIDPSGGPSASGTKKLITLTVVISHPNKKMNVLNVIRQSVVTTKNYELTIQKAS